MHKTRILVVEDEVLVAENIRERLKALGYDVPAVTSSGAEAVRIAQEVRPDVVLMDIQLEGQIDGVEAAAQIRARMNVPVIYLTAHVNETILERVKLTAPYGYILKPYQVRELHTTIEIALSKHELETKLQESETRYRQLFEGINDAVMVYSHQGYFLDCNQTALQWLGYTRAEFLQLSAIDIVHPDFHSKMQANREQLWTGKTLVIESVHLSQDGRKIPVEINAQQIEYQGEPAILAVVRDITERKQAEAELNRHRHHLEELVEERTAKLTEVNRQLQQEITERKGIEEALRQSREQYKDLVNSIDGIVWEADAETFKFTFISSQAERLLGYSLHQWLDDPDFWAEHIHPDDRDWAVSFCRKATRQKRDHEFEYRMITAQGEIVWLRDIVTVVVQNSKPVKLRGIMVDITEHKQAEEALRNSEAKFRHIYENAPVMMHSIDQSGRITDVNRKWLEETGYSQEEVLGQKADFLMTSESSHRAFSTVIPQFWRDGSIRNVPFQYIKKNGTPMDVLLNCDATLDPVGKQVSLSVVRDVTEQKRAEDQVKASLREKEVLLKEIHHRVKNNLQIISSLLYLQAKKIKDKQVLEIFQEGQNRIKSMALVHEKLYQSHNLARINFTEYVSNLTGYLFRSYGASAHHITRNIKIDKNLQLAISTAVPCGLIINELVSNALKYSFPPEVKQSGGEICIELQAETEGQFRLTISDNGVGLPAEVDFQNSSSLGLQLVNNLVRQLEGTIELDRRAGTRYTIIF